MRNRIAPLALVLAFIAVGALFGGYVTKVYIENGGNKLVVESGGEIEVQSGGTLDLQSGAVIPALDAYVLLAGSTQSISGRVDFTGVVVTPVAAAPPVACAAGTEGSTYIDSDVDFPCYCNGTNYVKFTDNSTTTGCS